MGVADVNAGWGAGRGTPAAGMLLANRYLLGERIGAGGMSEVFRAEDQVLSRPVAVKLFRFDAVAQDRSRVEAEVRTLSGLRHPGLVTVYDAGSGDPSRGGAAAFLVMELIEGPTLAQWLASHGGLEPEQAAALGTELAVSLDYVHGRNVVHRDVKPANILLDRHPSGGGFTPKLTDFGIARLIDSTRLTMHGTAVGTANYLSPEQAQGQPRTAASDIYSLGLVLLECLTGQVAYPGTGVPAALARLHRRASIPTRFGPPWTQLLSAMTDPDPLARPAAAAVYTTLSATADTTPGDPIRETPVSATTAASDPAAARTALLADAGPPGSTAVLPPVTSASPAATTLPRAPAALARRRRRYLLGAAVAAIVIALVILSLTRGTSHTTRPGPPPHYPSVPGQLGRDLRQLQSAVG